MKNISTFRLALWLGLLAEAMACCSIVLFLGYGSSVSIHSGFTTQLYTLAFMFQLPGMWLASRFMPLEILFGPCIVFTGTTLFTILFWVVIWVRRGLQGQNSPGEVTKEGTEGSGASTIAR
jgi:hypothetical protein